MISVHHLAFYKYGGYESRLEQMMFTSPVQTNSVGLLTHQRRRKKVLGRLNRGGRPRAGTSAGPVRTIGQQLLPSPLVMTDPREMQVKGKYTEWRPLQTPTRGSRRRPSPVRGPARPGAKSGQRGTAPPFPPPRVSREGYRVAVNESAATSTLSPPRRPNAVRGPQCYLAPFVRLPTNRQQPRPYPPPAPIEQYLWSEPQAYVRTVRRKEKSRAPFRVGGNGVYPKNGVFKETSTLILRGTELN